MSCRDRLQLIDASLDGELHLVQSLLDDPTTGLHVNSVDPYGHTALTAAASRGHLPLVQFLLKRGASAVSGGSVNESALALACQSGHHKVAAELIQHGFACQPEKENAYIPLISACVNGHIELVEELLSRGSVIDQNNTPWANTALHWAVRRRHDNLVTLLLARGAKPAVANIDGCSPLHFCCDDDAAHLVRQLIHAGCSVNAADAGGWRPLHVCGREHAQEVATELLAAGAEVDAVTLDGETAMMIGAKHGNVPFCRWLLQENADPRILADDHDSVLLIAARRGFTQLCKDVIERGADVLQCNKLSAFALGEAARFGHTECTVELLRQKADIHQTMVNGMEAVHIAIAQGEACNLEVLRVLFRNGALLETPCNTGLGPLQMACMPGVVTDDTPRRVVMTLLAHGADPRWTVPATEEGADPLPVAEATQCRVTRKVIEGVISKAADVPEIDLMMGVTRSLAAAAEELRQANNALNSSIEDQVLANQADQQEHRGLVAQLESLTACVTSLEEFRDKLKAEFNPPSPGGRKTMFDPKKKKAPADESSMGDMEPEAPVDLSTFDDPLMEVLVNGGVADRIGHDLLTQLGYAIMAEGFKRPELVEAETAADGDEDKYRPWLNAALDNLQDVQQDEDRNQMLQDVVDGLQAWSWAVYRADGAINFVHDLIAETTDAGERLSKKMKLKSEVVLEKKKAMLQCQRQAIEQYRQTPCLFWSVFHQLTQGGTDAEGNAFPAKLTEDWLQWILANLSDFANHLKQKVGSLCEGTPDPASEENAPFAWGVEAAPDRLEQLEEDPPYPTEVLTDPGADQKEQKKSPRRDLEVLRLEDYAKTNVSRIPIVEAPQDTNIDPITGEVLKDAVVASDGFTYERAAVEKWFAQHGPVSPITGQQLPNAELVQSHNQIRSAVQQEKEKPPKKDDKKKKGR